QHLRNAVQLPHQRDPATENVVGGAADPLQRCEDAVEQRDEDRNDDQQQDRVTDPPQHHLLVPPQLGLGWYGREKGRNTRPSASRIARKAIAKPLGAAGVAIWSGVRPRSPPEIRACIRAAKSRIRISVTSETMPRPYWAAGPDSCRSMATSTRLPPRAATT